MLSQIAIPPKLVPVFDFTKHYRFRGAHGGRGSAKTRTFAEMAAVRAWQLSTCNMSGVILCGREFMNSLEDSSMAEVKAAIESESWLREQYDIGEKYIRTKNRRVEFVFAGLRHNLDSIKSKSRILIAWIDEAEAVSETAWIKLLPTVREEGSEIWITWNPEKDGSPTDNRFVKHPPANSIIVELNYHDNPFFPDTLEQQRVDDQRRMDDGTYRWIWEGKYREESEAQIFAGCYEVAEFEPEEEWTLVQGLDWGFANDPTAAVRCYVWDNKLFISHEAVKVGLELDDTPKFIMDRIPDFEKWKTRADNARPESIRYVQRHGMTNVYACNKGKGSVEDGIAHIKSYDRVIIHPRCKEVKREFGAYSYKIDKLSGDIKPEPQDADNHCIAKGQKVWTARGAVPIENVNTGDFVMTRKGYQRVKKAWLSKKDADVYEVDCGVEKLIATANHKVYTVNRGFVRVDELRYTDDVLTGGASWQKLKQLRLMGLCGGGTLTQKILLISDITKRLLEMGRWLAYIGGYGKSIMGKSQKDTIFTTKTTILGTITSVILSAFKIEGICKVMPPKETGKVMSNWHILKEYARLQKRGIVHPKGKGYTAGLAAWFRKTSNLSTSLVSSAIRSSLPKPLEIETCFAVTSANQHGVEHRELMTRRELVSGAKKNLSPIKTQKPDFAVARVQCIRVMPIKVDCYDLEVEDQHEFFVSGVLVHNCIDAIRYALEPLMKASNFKLIVV